MSFPDILSTYHSHLSLYRQDPYTGHRGSTTTLEPEQKQVQIKSKISIPVLSSFPFSNSVPFSTSGKSVPITGMRDRRMGRRGEGQEREKMNTGRERKERENTPRKNTSRGNVMQRYDNWKNRGRSSNSEWIGMAQALNELEREENVDFEGLRAMQRMMTREYLMQMNYNLDQYASMIVFYEVELSKVFFATSKLPLPNVLRTQVCCALFERLCLENAFGIFKPIINIIKNELFRSSMQFVEKVTDFSFCKF